MNNKLLLHKKHLNIILISLLLGFQSSVLSQKDSIFHKSVLVTTGHNIGGIGYGGINGEYVLNKHIGIHTGICYEGYTYGVKLHLYECQSCPFLNISFKDNGWGELGTIGVELAADLFVLGKKKPIGLFAQFGCGYIVYLSNKKEGTMFKNETPDVIVTYGLGIRWNYVFLK